MMKNTSRVLGPAAILLLLPVMYLAGCSNLVSTAPSSVTAQPAALEGTLFGGQQPISGASIYIFTVGTTANKGSSTSLLSTSTSGVSTDSSGNGYVTTTSAGGYSIPSGALTCPSGNTSISTYFLAEGGLPGTGGTSNPAISLMAAVGACSALGVSVHHVVINEASTVAAVTALQQFMGDATHIGSYTNSTQPGYSSLANISNAMQVVNNLVNLADGSALTTPIYSSGTSPQAKLDTIANILAACVNSTGSGSTACSTLFNNAPSSSGTIPTDTLAAMLNIAQNPGSNVSKLFPLSANDPPFMPTLPIAPNDFTLGITFTGSGLTNPGAIASDNSGYMWLVNCASCAGGSGSDSVYSLSPAGAANATNSNYTSNVHSPVGIALDRYNAIWVLEASNGTLGNQVTRLNNTDGSVEYPTGNGGYFPVTLTGTPGGLAIVEDSPSAAWITDSTNGQMSLIKYDGTTLSTISTSGLSNPTAIAADGLEHLYVIGTGSSNIVQFYPTYDRSQIYGTIQPTTSPGSYTFSGSSAGVSSPVSLALDGGDHLWTVDTGTPAVSKEFVYNQVADSGPTGYTGNINTATQVTIDGSGTAWIANCRASCSTSGSTAADNIVHLTAAGVSAVPSDGIQESELAQPTATAVDLSGNLWISNASGASVTELVGVAVPVVTELETASSRDALGAANYLYNGSFELGGTGADVPVPGWSFGGSNYTVDTSSFSGQQRMYYYNGSPYTQTATQTVSLPNGNYIASCYVAGAPGSSTQTEQMQVSGYGGTEIDYTLSGASYTFQQFAISNIAVTSGSLTLTLYNNETYSGGGYEGWDACSVIAQ